MLRFAIRRLMWALPTLFGISLVVFFLTTLVPSPVSRAPKQGDVLLDATPLVDDDTQEERRRRFLDLPRFVNARPQDLKTRTLDCLAHISAWDQQAPGCTSELARIGGASLPYVLPRLEALAPEPRGRLAVSLLPVARRMGTPSEDLARIADPAAAVQFWMRMWEDRAIEFTPPVARREVGRLITYGSRERERHVAELDTFALPELMEGIDTTADPATIERLIRVAAHVSGRNIRVPRDARPEDVDRVVAGWREWWYVHRTDYVALEGAERIAAVVGQSRYGKWLERTARGELGVSTRDQEPILRKLKRRAPVTLVLLLLAMLTSYALAVPVGVITAWRRAKGVDIAFAGVLFVLYTLPPFLAAELLRRVFERPGDGLRGIVLPTLALSASGVATLARHERIAMVEVLAQDYVRTARAKGLPEWRVIVVHALRNALLPTVTLAGLELPSLLAASLVVEEVFGVPGVGYETVRAVESSDIPWLMAIVLLSALVATLGLIVSDLAHCVLDPRVRRSFFGRDT